MDFKTKYLKYKNKYTTLKNKLSGGSYTLSKEVVVDHVGDEIKYIYPEVTIITSKTKIGSGGTGSVTLGRIENCILNPSLNGRQIAIKNFVEYDTESKEKEKRNMLTYRIDEDGKIIEHPLIASLYFDIKYGPLKNKLIYEYGGKTLSAYRVGVPEYSLENNKRILIDLFTIFAELVHKDNMHNDIKCANTVYSIEPTGVVKTKLIDFGSSRSISQMESGIDSFKSRTNINNFTKK